MKQKQEIRLKIKVIRESLDEAVLKLAAEAVTKSFIEAAFLADARNVLCYLPINNEVDTHPLIDDLMALDKKIYVPAFDNDKRKYVFAEFNSWDNLAVGPYDVLQPVESHEIDVAGIDLVIVPGIAFGTAGFRLGYGKGVYDKLLAGTSCIKIGLAYDFQILDELPAEAHDLKMDFVITEKKIYRFS